MISHSEAGLREILRCNKIPEEQIKVVEQRLREPESARQDDFHYANGQLRASRDISGTVFVNPMIYGTFADNLLTQSLADSLDNQQIVQVGLNANCCTVLEPIKYQAPALSYCRPDLAPHPLCLDDIQVNNGVFQVKGRNVTDLEFGDGELLAVYGGLRFFDFSYNPELRASEIVEFLAANSFSPSEVLVAGTVQDCTLDKSVYVCYDEEVAGESEVLSFEMVEADRDYANCSVLYVSEEELEHVDFSRFPGLLQLRVSFQRAFDVGRLKKYNINGEILREPVIFMLDNQLQVTQQQLDQIKANLNAARGKLLFNHEVERTVEQDGRLTVANAENNALFGLFFGPLSNLAKEKQLSEANFLNIYHESSDQIVEILVQRQEIKKNEPIYLYQEYLVQDKENCLLCQLFNGEEVAKCSYPVVQSDLLFDEIRNENSLRVMQGVKPDYFFSSSSQEVAQLCQLSCEKFISDKMTMHSKKETVLLLLAGIIKHVVCYQDYEICIVVNNGSVQKLHLEYYSQKEPQISRCEISTDGIIKRAHELRSFSSAIILASARLSTFCFLDVSQ